MSESIEALPLPWETLQALRSMGYEFPQAVADVTDNSVDAGATRIDVSVYPDPDKPQLSYVAIMDNGCGMTSEELVSAMTLGSSGSAEDDLGKFGMGMKTASLSQCNRLVVGSVKDGRFSGRCWDMDILKAKGKWLLQSVEINEFPAPAKAHLESVKSGTVVLWSKLLSSKGMNAHNAARILESATMNSMRYLATVFHRHLSGEVKGRKFELLLNETAVLPWDPFCAKEKKRRNLGQKKFKVESENGEIGEITLTPYLLPSQEDFSSAGAFNAAAGIDKWNEMQGFYFYRNDRIVKYSGWDRMRSKDEKTKFLRVAVEYTVNQEMDTQMGINVSKRDARIPVVLRQKVDGVLSDWLGEARRSYSNDSDEPIAFREKKYSLSQVEKLVLKHVPAEHAKMIKMAFKKITASA
jgi:hypothetical protein